MELPRVVGLRQLFAEDRLDDIVATIRDQFVAIGAASRIRKGARVAIPVGSRGIAELVTILRTVAEEVKRIGAKPFFVCAMGAHGGATAEGQLEVARGYGVTEETVGGPIVSSMAVVQVGVAANGAPVYMDQHAYLADHTIVIGRVKPHTAFRGPVESGLCKMMAVGLGKREGAEAMHKHGLAESIPEAARVLLAKANIAFGIAIVENAYDRPVRIEAVPPAGTIDSDKRLLDLANSLLPRIPFDPLDVLVVDLVGKNLSGSGLDYNVIGMWRRLGGPQRPYFRYIVVLDITAESEGNALGVGIADFTTRRLVSKINYEATYTNALTSAAIEAAKVPIALANDREAIRTAYDMAMRDCREGQLPRLARICSTLHLDRLQASENLLPEIVANPALKLEGPPLPFRFDESDNLTPM